MKRIGQRNNIRIVFNSKETLRSKLVNFKPKKGTESAKEVIYEIPCECGKSYIGETGRKLETRLKEHKASLWRGDPEISKLTEHSHVRIYSNSRKPKSSGRNQTGAGEKYMRRVKFWKAEKKLSAPPVLK
jgi:hypothetical protein